MDISVPHFDMARLFAQACGQAFRAAGGIDIFGQLIAYRTGVTFAVTALQVIDNPLERMRLGEISAALIQVFESNLFAPGTIEQRMLSGFRQLFEG